ncbi:MAG TPA: site-2 protease family protein, partial [Chitinophagaceae bacterium]|nr:site-2 protease family protein [Chitinophagaceae bacterium]
ADTNTDRPSSENHFAYPPKPEPAEKKGNVWIRSITSLALYLLIGYYFFSANWILVLILTGIVMFHELGHFLAMKIYDYKELGIFFIPLLGAYASGTKREVSQKQSAIILLAGPMPGIILGVALYFLTSDRSVEMPYQTFGILRITATLLIFLNVLNLLPVYPLDGGQLVNRLFLDDTNFIGKIFVVLSALALGYLLIRLGMTNSFLYVLLFFPVMMLVRLFSEDKNEKLTKVIEARGINLEKTYEEITDEEYWRIRNILIESNYPTLRNIKPAPPYEYSASEDKVVTALESLLQRTIIQDLSWVGKGIIILIWIGSFATPFLLRMDLPFIHHS